MEDGGAPGWETHQEKENDAGTDEPDLCGIGERDAGVASGRRGRGWRGSAGGRRGGAGSSDACGYGEMTCRCNGQEGDEGPGKMIHCRLRREILMIDRAEEKAEG